MSVTIENTDLKINSGLSQRAKEVGEKIAGDLFTGLKLVRDREGKVRFDQISIAELFGAMYEIGRAETLHQSFCVKGRQS